MMSLADNPFAVLSAVAAPAVLTNVCSVLSLGTGNRLARVVDRSRVLIELKKSTPKESPDYVSYAKQLKNQRTRARLLLRALRLFYAGLAMFAMTALVAIVGSILVAYQIPFAFRVSGLIGFLVGGGGVMAVVTGCAIMTHETRIAVENLSEEHRSAIGGDDR